jgi:8-oxo-dGTP pyrophosphatase MutT (NUDIX family)
MYNLGEKIIDLISLKKIIDNGSGPGPPPDNQLRPTCVFLLLYNKDDPHCLVIQKSDSDGYPWRNQVALPGGHIDKSDASPLEAAYRELKEEVNIPPNQVELIGSLGHFQTLVKPRDIEVFVGWWNGEGPVSIDPVEISRVLEIPLKSLIETHVVNGYHNRQFGVKELTYPFLDVVIWGASARIIHHFIERIYPVLHNDGYLVNAKN